MTRVHLTLTERKGALLRVLGTMERRGYRPVKLEMKEASTPQTLLLDMIIQSTRPTDLLVRQLLKLCDVRQVRIGVS
jgi:acetolactate synthase II small subunit